jgi:hypothetical protein
MVQVSLQQRARWELCCVRSLCLHGVASEKSVLQCDVIAAARRRPRPPTSAQRILGREALSGRLPSDAPLRNPTESWHITIYTIYTGPLSVQDQYSRFCPVSSSSCYDSLVTWTVVCLTTANTSSFVLYNHSARTTAENTAFQYPFYCCMSI